MEQRTYRGEITPEGMANALVAQFNGGDQMAQKVGQGEHVLVQIASRDWDFGGPQNALTVGITQSEGGVEVTLGQQRWLGAAAELAQAGLMALVNPLSLLGRIDDIARSVSSLTLPQQAWEAVDHYCESVGASLGLRSEETMLTCPYCGVGNPIAAPKCSACGAGLGDFQPIDCPQCGLVMPHDAKFCSRCGENIASDAPDRPSGPRSITDMFRRSQRRR